jgi:hypothetical protein
VTVRDSLLAHATELANITVLPSPDTSVESVQVVLNKPVNQEILISAELCFKIELETSHPLFI